MLIVWNSYKAGNIILTVSDQCNIQVGINRALNSVLDKSNQHIQNSNQVH